MIGQKHTPGGSNKIAVVPELLNALMLQGCILTKIIVERGVDYVFPAKENHPALYTDVQRVSESETQTDFRHARHSAVETVERGYGRIEMRCYAKAVDLAISPSQSRWPLG